MTEEQIKKLVAAANSTNATASEIGTRKLAEAGYDKNGNSLKKQEPKAKKEKEKEVVEEPKEEAPKKVKVKKEPKKKVLEEYKIVVDGKEYSVDDCEEAIKAWKARRKQSKEANKEYKTKPVTEKITDNVATAVKQAVDSVSDSKVENQPAKVIKDISAVKKAVTSLFDSLESLTGKKISAEKRKQVMSILLDLEEEAKENK